MRDAFSVIGAIGEDAFDKGERAARGLKQGHSAVAKEIQMYVDYFEKIVQRCGYTDMEVKKVREFKANLEKGMDLCLQFAAKTPYEGENLASIPPCVEKEKARLNSIFAEFESEILVTVAR